MARLATQYDPALPDAYLIGGRGLLMGWSIVENAGTPAVASFQILDGITNGDRAMMAVGVLASGASTVWFGPQGILFERGLYIKKISGSWTGGIFYLPETLTAPGYIIDESSSDRQIHEVLTQVDFNNMSGLV